MRTRKKSMYMSYDKRKIAVISCKDKVYIPKYLENKR